MKKEILLTGLLTLLVLGSGLAFAQPTEIPPIGPVPSDFTTVYGVWNVVLTVLRWFYIILFIVAVFFILLAAFNFITSKGDAGKVGDAKKQLLYAAIGIAVGLLSYAIIELIRNAVITGGRG